MLRDPDYHHTEFQNPTILIDVYKNLENLSFLTSWIIHAAVNPVKFLRSSLNLTIKNIFFKSNLKRSRFYMIWTTTPQSFIALGFFIRVYKNLENFFIFHVLDHTVSPRLLSTRLISYEPRLISASRIFFKNQIKKGAVST